MTDFAHSCQIRPARNGNHLPEDVQDAADALACLLTDTREFQEFLRMDRAVRIDPDASRLRGLLDNPDGGEFDPVDVQAHLEALPASQAYAASRKAVREVIGAVEAIIAQTAGLPFAENAIVDGAT